MGRFAIQVVTEGHKPLFFSGGSREGMTWTGKPSRSTKFATFVDATSYALVLAVEDPTLIQSLEIVDLDTMQVRT